MCRRIGFGVAVAVCLAIVVQTVASAAPLAKSFGKIRTYYVTADEIEWDYAPTGVDHMTGRPFEGFSKLQTERGPNRINTNRPLGARMNPWNGGAK